MLGLNWQCNYRIGYSCNVDGKQYITHSNTFLCATTTSSNTAPILWNSRAFILPPGYISLISVQAPTELDTKHLYSGIMPLAVDHKIDHKYPKLLKIPLPNTEQNTVCIPRKPIIGSLQPIDVEDFEVSNISWTTDGTADTTNSPKELTCMPPESSFQPDYSNTKHSVVLQDAYIPQTGKGRLYFLFKGEYNSIISKSPTGVGRTNLFQMDIPNVGPPIACQPYSIPLKYQKFVSEEIRLLENGFISKSLSPWTTPVSIVPKIPDPSSPQKQQLHLVLDYRSFYKSVNAAHNGNSVIFYYPLPNIMDLLARLQKCAIFSALDYHYISLTPEPKLKTAFTTTSGKWHWSVAPFSIYSLSGVFCYLMLQVLSCLDFCLAYLYGNDLQCVME